MSTAADTRPRAHRVDPPQRGGQQTLAGTGALIRFILRRDRIKLPAWLLGITVMLAYYTALLPTVYEGDEEMQSLASFMTGPVGALISGPGYGADQLNLERLIVGVYGIYFLLLAALMNMLLVSRHTRVDEQHGRTELLRATVVGRHAPLTAVLTVAVAANALLALLLTGVMVGNDFDAGQSLLFGAGVGAAGLLFAGVTALTVQITEYSRAATGLAGAVLGVAWVIRAAGDMLAQHGSALSWFSPLAWVQQTRPYVDGRWWPLLLVVGLTAVVTAVAYALASRRDVGAGLLAARRGSPSAAAWLASPLAFAFRLHRASLIGWGIALGLAGLLWGWITEPMIDTYEGMGDDILAIFGGDASNIIDGYLSVMALVTALLVGVFVILGVQTLRVEETKGRAEPVLATAISRWSWAGSHLVVLALGVIGLLLLAGITTGIGAAASLGDAGYAWEVTLAHLAHTPAVLLLLGIAALLFGAVPKAIGAVWAVLGYGMLIGFFGPLMDPPQWAYDISPFEHVARAPLDDLTVSPILALTGVAVVLLAAGLAGFRRRDLETK
ncbi:ABC transporter permease [Natronosporangium hydrolyticum]|uniref:ABC transporter permease n=1 Tax=Natronosporangium hydrolyticum TaxID=2811111 RepID=A0A895YBQ9_9ACTN|nr:ABC transporter permease [Natronosporangium hydrolyticum]QSB15207.1 ABC transporter permease [Natronosporangium hydrolyticum]